MKQQRRSTQTKTQPDCSISNLHQRTIEGFGLEWQSFDQSEKALDAVTRQKLFENYFRIFPWDTLPAKAEGLDFGCGSGRWAALVAPRVGKLHVVDASVEALNVARRNLSTLSNIEFHHSHASALPMSDQSLDFAFSLGVLHHLPDTQRAISDIATKLKPGAPFLIYLYYSFDNRPAWFRSIWSISNVMRSLICRMPHILKLATTTMLAALVYWPLATIARLLNTIGLPYSFLPLSFYRDKPFYVMRTDSYDRFSTSLEHRYSKIEIRKMMQESGLTDVQFSDNEPYWCAIGIKAEAKKS